MICELSWISCHYRREFYAFMASTVPGGFKYLPPLSEPVEARSAISVKAHFWLVLRFFAARRRNGPTKSIDVITTSSCFISKNFALNNTIQRNKLRSSSPVSVCTKWLIYWHPKRYFALFHSSREAALSMLWPFLICYLAKFNKFYQTYWK